MKVDDLKGSQINRAVALAIGYILRSGLSGNTPCWLVYKDNGDFVGYIDGDHVPQYSPLTSWSDGGPLIEEFAVKVKPVSDAYWRAEEVITCQTGGGFSPLEAICKACIKSEYGDDIPDIMLT